MDLLKYILGEFSIIRGAPIAFILSLVAASLLIFYLMTWGYGRENSYLRTLLDDYKEKLKGATPQEARDRIDALETAANRKEMAAANRNGNGSSYWAVEGCR